MQRIKTLCVRIRHAFSRRLEAMKQAVNLRVKTLSPQGNLRLVSPKTYLRELATNQTGAISMKTLEVAIVGLILIIFLVQFFWQQGLPMLIETTANTTALEEAGATTAQIGWVQWVGGILIVILLLSLLFLGFKSMGFSGGGGGGSRWRRKRR